MTIHQFELHFHSLHISEQKERLQHDDFIESRENSSQQTVTAVTVRKADADKESDTSPEAEEVEKNIFSEGMKGMKSDNHEDMVDTTNEYNFGSCELPRISNDLMPEVKIEKLTEEDIKAASNFTILKGRKKGSNIYVHGDYGYVIDRENRTKELMYLRCKTYKSKNCKGRALINKKSIPYVMSTTYAHSCDDQKEMKPDDMLNYEENVKVDMDFAEDLQFPIKSVAETLDYDPNIQHEDFVESEYQDDSYEDDDYEITRDNRRNQIKSEITKRKKHVKRLCNKLDSKDNAMSGANFKIFEGQRKGSIIFVYGNYGYVTDRENRTKELMYLRCKTYKSKNCKGRAVINKKSIPYIMSNTNSHSCNEKEDESMTDQRSTDEENIKEDIDCSDDLQFLIQDSGVKSDFETLQHEDFVESEYKDDYEAQIKHRGTKRKNHLKKLYSKLDSEDSAMSGANFKVLKGQRKGSTIYVHGDYGYTIDRENKTKELIYLRCKTYKSKNCKGRAVINKKSIPYVISTTHDHSCNEQRKTKSDEMSTQEENIEEDNEDMQFLTEDPTEMPDVGNNSQHRDFVESEYQDDSLEDNDYEVDKESTKNQLKHKKTKKKKPFKKLRDKFDNEANVMSGANFIRIPGHMKKSIVYLYCGHGYTIDREGESASYLRCRNKKSQGCKGRASIETKLVPYMMSNTFKHSCDDSEESLAKDVLAKAMKRDAEKTDIPLEQIWENRCSGNPYADWLTRSEILSQLEKFRKSVQKVPKVPKVRKRDIDNSIRFKCIFHDCEEIISQKTHIKHVQQKHGGSLTCAICKAKFPDTYTALTHQAKVHETTMKCRPCNQVFITYQHFRRHHRIHAGLITSCVCDLCGKVLKNKGSYNVHMLCMHSEKRFKCYQCDYKTNFKINLQHHIEDIHEGIVRICEICGHTVRTFKGKFD